MNCRVTGIYYVIYVKNTGTFPGKLKKGGAAKFMGKYYKQFNLKCHEHHTANSSRACDHSALHDH
jgi:hypothetical protein